MVMVVAERSMNGIRLRVVTGWDVVRRCDENERKGGLRRIIQHTVQVLLVRARIARIPVKDFADNVDACSLLEASPEALVHLLGAVEA